MCPQVDRMWWASCIPHCLYHNAGKSICIVTAIHVSSSNLGIDKTIFSINTMNMLTVVNNFSLAAWKIEIQFQNGFWQIVAYLYGTAQVFRILINYWLPQENHTLFGSCSLVNTKFQIKKPKQRNSSKHSNKL